MLSVLLHLFTRTVPRPAKGLAIAFTCSSLPEGFLWPLETTEFVLWADRKCWGVTHAEEALTTGKEELMDRYSDGKLLDIFYMVIQRASVDLNFSCPDL